MYAQHIVGKQKRPEIDPEWTDDVGDLIQRCWSSDLSNRPKFSVVTKALEEIVSQYEIAKSRHSMRGALSRSLNSLGLSMRSGNLNMSLRNSMRKMSVHSMNTSLSKKYAKSPTT